jgi:hypothetical protein
MLDGGARLVLLSTPAVAARRAGEEAMVHFVGLVLMSPFAVITY